MSKGIIKPDINKRAAVLIKCFGSPLYVLM